MDTEIDTERDRYSRVINLERKKKDWDRLNKAISFTLAY